MRFGVLTQYYPPEIGAPQSRLFDLVSRFSARGHEVFVLTAMPNYPTGAVYPGYGGIVRREKLGGAEIVRTFIYPAKSVGMRRLASYFSFVLSSIIPGSFYLPRLDYLLTESPPLFLGISGFLLSRMTRSRWILNVSDLWPQSAVELGVVDDGWQLRMTERLESFCYRRAFLVTGQSLGILANIERRFPAISTYHLPHGVHPERFRLDRPDPEARSRLAGGVEPAGTCIVIYTGLHGIAQGLDMVLDAASRLAGAPSLQVVLIGDGPEKETLVARAREKALSNVSFLDAVPASEVPTLLAAADVALAPLKRQLTGAVPSKIYEAMAAGVPVVGVCADEPAKIIRNAGAGLVVEPGDSEGLAQALRRLASDPPLRRRLGAAGRRAVDGQYDRRAIGDRFVDYLEEHQ